MSYPADKDKWKRERKRNSFSIDEEEEVPERGLPLKVNRVDRLYLLGLCWCASWVGPGLFQNLSCCLFPWKGPLEQQTGCQERWQLNGAEPGFREILSTQHTMLWLSAGTVDMGTGSLTSKTKFNIEHAMLSDGHRSYVDEGGPISSPWVTFSFQHWVVAT